MANRPWDEQRQALTTALKKLRMDGDITQEELASRLDRPQSYVSKYENGERKLDFIEVLEVCAALRIQPEALIKLYQALLI